MIQISKNGKNSSNMYYMHMALLKEICTDKNDKNLIISIFLKIKLWKREY